MIRLRTDSRFLGFVPYYNPSDMAQLGYILVDDIRVLEAQPAFKGTGYQLYARTSHARESAAYLISPSSFSTRESVLESAQNILSGMG